MAKTKPLKPGPTETQVLQQVLEALLLYGLDVDRQNTAAFMNPNGQFVRCGKSGNSDITGMLTAGPGRGRKVDVEVKKPGFNPLKPGNTKDKERWARQLVRLQKTNANGGYGFWVTDVSQVTHVLSRINEGWRVVVADDGSEWVTDEESN